MSGSEEDMIIVGVGDDPLRDYSLPRCDTNCSISMLPSFKTASA